jgi:hypothetical protein
MRPFTFDGTVIFSSASSAKRSASSRSNPCRTDYTPCIDWQYSILGSDSSRIGTAGARPTLPNNYPLQRNQNIIIAEAYLHYRPILSISSTFVPAFTPQTIYKVAIFKPRQGTLMTLPVAPPILR